MIKDNKVLNTEFILSNVDAYVNGSLLKSCYIYIKNGWIENIFDVDPNLDVQVIDVSDYIVFPGLSNNHTHCAMNFLRGYTHGSATMIGDIFFKTEKQLDEQLVESLSFPYLISGLRSGVTHFSDHYYFHHGTAKAMEKLGVRGHLGQWVGDLGGAFPASVDWNSLKKEIESWNYSSRVRPILCPHASDTVSKKLGKELSDFAKVNDLNLHFHLSQRKEEVEFAKQQYDQTPVEVAKEMGWLTPKSLAVHLLYSNFEDQKILFDSGVFIGSCPNSQIIYDSIAPIEKYWGKNKFLLGTDCAASNDQGDMLNELSTLAKFLLDRKVKSPSLYKDIIATASSNASDFYGTPMGELKPGMYADLVLVKKSIELLPIIDISASLLFAMGSQFVEHVMVDGKWVLLDREPVNIEMLDIKNSYLDSVSKITID
ncbi:MAG: amidohydrolase family protein [Bdellovibrionales bacterium]